MKENETRIAVCPKCGRTYTGHPALSRIIPEMFICPDCGIREALDSIGVSEAEQEEILRAIHHRN